MDKGPVVRPKLMTSSIPLGIALLLLFPFVTGSLGESRFAADNTPPFPESGAYVGAYIEFGELEDSVTLDAIEDFEALVEKHQGIIAFSSFWGEQNFPSRNLHIISRHGALPLIFWSPWDRPYVEDKGPDRFSLENILAGCCDAYIDHWADQAKAYGNPLLVSWGLEMNGDWFPWSGYFNVPKQPSERDGRDMTAGPELFKKAFRYVVERVRSRGVDNILWGFHANCLSYPREDWNTLQSYYPGSDYVDWLGLSVYGKQFSQEEWTGFRTLMDAAYGQLCALDPKKPVVLAEWGIGEFPDAGNKALWLQEAFDALTHDYPRVKAAVYWHERWRNADDSYSNLRVNSSVEALEVYRKAMRNPYWVDDIEPGSAR